MGVCWTTRSPPFLSPPREGNSLPHARAVSASLPPPHPFPTLLTLAQPPQAALLLALRTHREKLLQSNFLPSLKVVVGGVATWQQQGCQGVKTSTGRAELDDKP